MELFILWILCAVIGALIGKAKGAGGKGFLLGLLLGPIGCIIAIFIGGKYCPYCQKKVHADAIKCPHCQSDLVTRAAGEMSVAELIQTIMNGSEDNFKKIRRLANMRDKKLITDAHFEKLKAELSE